MAPKAAGNKNMKRGGNKHGAKKSGGGGGGKGGGGGIDGRKGSFGAGGGKKPNLKKKSKLVVTFDPEKRIEYLTGFHKRKQDRRRFGLDMEAFKQQKRLLEARKQRREEQKAKLKELNVLEPLPEDKKDDSDGDDDNEEEEEAAMTKVMQFDDEHTQNKFGDVVTVTTSIGDLKSDSSEDEISDEEYDISDDEDEEGASGVAKSGGDKHAKYKEKQLSLFQRIQLKRRGMALPSKRAKLKDARANRKATLGRKGHKAKAVPRSKDKDSVEVVAKPKKGAFGKGKFSKR